MKSLIETEIKLPAGDAEQGSGLLLNAGFQIAVPRIFERNTVLDDGNAALRASGRLLRLRQAGSIVTCTYKGKSLPGPHKQREEREFRADSFDDVLAVFQGLGYAERFRYEKYRTEFERPGEHGIATLDETPVGCYFELEGTPEWIDRTAAELGFTPAQYVTSSYAKLYLEWCAKQGLQPANMTF